MTLMGGLGGGSERGPKGRGYMYTYRASQAVLVEKHLPANAGEVRDAGLIPGLGKSPEGMATHSVFFPGESHGQKSLAAYSL